MQTYRPGLFASTRWVVLGGTTGIGLAIAQAAKRLEAEVHVASRSRDHVEAAVATLRREGLSPAVGHVADVRQSETLEALAKRIGPVDVLVNAAAGNFPAPFDAMSARAFSTVVDIVLGGTVSACRAFRPTLSPTGSVLNVVAGYAWTGAPGVSHSGAAKAAVLNLTRSLAVEWAPLRVNALAPGPIDGTEGVRRLADDLGLRGAMTASVPLGRLGRLEEIADAAVFLASPAAAYITGACLVADGGMDARGPFAGLFGMDASSAPHVGARPATT